MILEQLVCRLFGHTTFETDRREVCRRCGHQRGPIHRPDTTTDDTDETEAGDHENTHARRVARQLRQASQTEGVGEDEIYRIDCPECGHPVDEWCECPQCDWFDIDRWRAELPVSQTLSNGGRDDAE